MVTEMCIPSTIEDPLIKDTTVALPVNYHPRPDPNGNHPRGLTCLAGVGVSGPDPSRLEKDRPISIRQNHQAVRIQRTVHQTSLLWLG